MKTLLLRVAATLLVSTAAAHAGKTTIGLTGQCDVLTLTSQVYGKDKAYSAVGTYSVEMSGVCEGAFGYGGLGKAQSLGSGNFINMGMVVSGDPNLYTLQLQSPLVNGNAWYKFQSTDGINFTEIGSGTYKVTKEPSIRPQGKSAILDH
jgi:hypothetical protein